MNTITRDLPCEPVVDGLPTLCSFTGVDVGCLFVHKSFPDEQCPQRRSGWTITHTATGYSIHKYIPTHTRAISAARQLAKLPCWDFCAVDQAKSIDPGVLALIHDIRRRA